MEREILKLMEQMRLQMVKSGLELGFEHPLVLEYSQRLDRLHILWLRRQRRKQNKTCEGFIRERRARYA